MNTWQRAGQYAVCYAARAPSGVFLCECLTWAHLPLWSRYHPHPEPGRPSWRFQPTWLSVPPFRRTFWGQMFLLQKAKTEGTGWTIHKIFQLCISRFKMFGKFKWAVAHKQSRTDLGLKKKCECICCDCQYPKLTSGTLGLFPLRILCRLLQTCKGFKSFLDLLSFQQICHRHFVSWREGGHKRYQVRNDWEMFSVSKCREMETREWGISNKSWRPNLKL